jgi:hypothetical protein
MRVWVYRGGEWTDGILARWSYSAGYAYVAPLHPSHGDARPTLPHFLALEQPHDCGALIPPQGLHGIEWWLQRDASVFANVPGVGASVPRPPILFV